MILSEHIGTHVDAPAHYIAGGKNWIDELPPESFMGPCCTIDAQKIGPKGLLEEGHVKGWELEHGQITAWDIILVNFGWYKRWGIGTAGLGYLRDWPGIFESASTYLADLKVKLVGVDVVSTDAYNDFSNSSDYPPSKSSLERNMSGGRID